MRRKQLNRSSEAAYMMASVLGQRSCLLPIYMQCILREDSQPGSKMDEFRVSTIRKELFFFCVGVRAADISHFFLVYEKRLRNS